MGRVKDLCCGNCDAPPPSEAHHITDCGRRVSHYLVISLCVDCHRNKFLGIHGEKRAWLITRKTELSVLADTIKLLTNEA